MKYLKACLSLVLVRIFLVVQCLRLQASTAEGSISLGELRAHMLPGMAKKMKINKSIFVNSIGAFK